MHIDLICSKKYNCIIYISEETLMKVIKNYVTILCSAAFCFSLALTGCKGKNKNGIPDGYYEVLFDTKGGTAIEHQVVKDGAKATKPADPTNPGQIFTGWYWDFEAATPFDFDTPITSTTTIYAGWELDRDSFYGGQGTADNPGGGGGGGSVTYTVTSLPDWIGNDGCVIFAWTWSSTDTGSWHKMTISTTTGTFKVNSQLTGFNMARCKAGTTTPSWTATGDSQGRVYNKTGDVTCSSGVYSYASPSWVEYNP